MCCQDSTIGPPWISSSSLTLLRASQNCIRAYCGYMMLYLNHVYDSLICTWMHIYAIHAVGAAFRASLHAPNTLLAELGRHTLQVGAKMSWSCVAKQTFRAQLAVCDKGCIPNLFGNGCLGLHWGGFGNYVSQLQVVITAPWQAGGGTFRRKVDNCPKVTKRVCLQSILHHDWNHTTAKHQ